MIWKMPFVDAPLIIYTQKYAHLISTFNLQCNNKVEIKSTTQKKVEINSVKKAFFKISVSNSYTGFQLFVITYKQL